MNKKIYKIQGMDCEACAMLIEGELEDIGINAKCSYARQTLEIEQKSKEIHEDKIKSLVQDLGYELAS